jgi:hypothetical protein
LREKRSGKPIAAKARPKGENVVDLMDALKRSIANDRGSEPVKGKRPCKAAAGQKEMLLPISGKRAAKRRSKERQVSGVESLETNITRDIATRRINNRKAWTADEDERLRQLVISNASLSDIAGDLGRTASAVRARAHAKRIALGRPNYNERRQNDSATPPV